MIPGEAPNTPDADQVRDCLDRGWIVVVPSYRACAAPTSPVHLLEGPMQDCRDALSWVHSSLEDHIARHDGGPYLVDVDHVFACGTGAAGGHLALALGFGVVRPAAGICDMCGACGFADTAAWAEKLLFRESHHQSADSFCAVDPLLNVSSTFPPTVIVHGSDDRSVPLQLSEKLYAELQKEGVKSRLIVVVPGEEDPSDQSVVTKKAAGTATWQQQQRRQGFDFLEALLSRDNMQGERPFLT